MYEFKVKYLSDDGKELDDVTRGTWESVVADYKEKGLISITCYGKA